MGVLNSTLSSAVTVLMFGSVMVTTAEDDVVVKFGAKSEISVCGVMFCADVNVPPLAPLVLVDVEHWERRLPVAPLLAALGDGRPLGDVVHVVADVDAAVEVLDRAAPHHP